MVVPCFVQDRHIVPFNSNVLGHGSESPQEDMALNPDILFWLSVDQSLLLLLNAVCLLEKQQYQF